MMSPVFLRKGRITMKNIKTRDLIYCALFAALTAIGAFLHFQLFQATITLQFFFTAMAGLLLGAKLGALSQLLYVALGLVGVPIFAAGGGALAGVNCSAHAASVSLSPGALCRTQRRYLYGSSLVSFAVSIKL